MAKKHHRFKQKKFKGSDRRPVVPGQEVDSDEPTDVSKLIQDVKDLGEDGKRINSVPRRRL